MRTTALLVLCLTACSPRPSPGDRPLAPEALAGTYTVDHQVGVFDGTDFVPMDATDRLALVPVGDSLDISLVLIHANAHICEMHGRLGREGDQWVERSPLPYGEPDAVCTLALEVSADTLHLRDEDQQCRRAYCGARGSINGAAFPRSSRTTDTSWRDDLR